MNYLHDIIRRLLFLGKQGYMDGIDYSKKWQVMVAVSFGVFLATIDSSIVNISLPTLEKDLQTNFATVQWVVLAYLLTITVLLLGIGRLADIIGKKSLYILGFLVFLVGSFLCGLSSSVEFLISFRVLQAIGGAFLMALGPALLAEGFPPGERGRALGINGLAVSLGIILGPTMGGLILANFGWHWIFFVNLPIGAIAIPIAISSLPKNQHNKGEKFDFAGAFLLLLSLSSLLFGLTFSQDKGFLSPESLSLFALFVIFLVLFIRTEQKVEQPVVELHLFHNLIFSVNLITGFLTFVASAGTIFLIPFYLQNVLGYNPEFAGMLMAVFPIMLGISGPLSGWLSDRFGFRLLTVLGLIVLTGSYFNLTRLSTTTTWQEFILIYLPIGIGMGLFQSPNNSAILSTASAKRLGVVSGLLAITRTLGQTSGIAIMGAIWTAMVFQQSGFLSDGATAALAVYQVTGLRYVWSLLGFILLAGTFLSIIAWIKERKSV
jgi:EmrB/QacA subfamily drug resistance transporter